MAKFGSAPRRPVDQFARAIDFAQCPGRDREDRHHHSTNVVAKTLPHLLVTLRVAINESPLALASRFEECSAEVVNQHETAARNVAFDPVVRILRLAEHRRSELACRAQFAARNSHGPLSMGSRQPLRKVPCFRSKLYGARKSVRRFLGSETFRPHLRVG